MSIWHAMLKLLGSLNLVCCVTWVSEVLLIRSSVASSHVMSISGLSKLSFRRTNQLSYYTYFQGFKSSEEPK
jgi:hypothetical protein